MPYSPELHFIISIISMLARFKLLPPLSNASLGGKKKKKKKVFFMSFFSYSTLSFHVCNFSLLCLSADCLDRK